MLALAQALEIIHALFRAVVGHGEAPEAHRHEQGLLWKVALVRLIGGSSISGCLQTELGRRSKLTGTDLAGENQPRAPVYNT